MMDESITIMPAKDFIRMCDYNRKMARALRKIRAISIADTRETASDAAKTYYKAIWAVLDDLDEDEL